MASGNGRYYGGEKESCPLHAKSPSRQGWRMVPSPAGFWGTPLITSRTRVLPARKTLRSLSGQMIRPSFVPRRRSAGSVMSPATGRTWPGHGRRRRTARRSCWRTRASKLPVVASDIFGKSGRAMMAALIAGERNPKVLAQLARARMRGKISPALGTRQVPEVGIKSLSRWST